MQANIQQSQQAEFDTGHICSIVPMFLLESLANSSEVSDEVKQSALSSIEHTSRLMQHRFASITANPQPSTSSYATVKAASSSSSTPKPYGRMIYSIASNGARPGKLMRKDKDLMHAYSQASPDDLKRVNECFKHFGHVLDFYKECFKRDSIDDKGKTLLGSIHYGKRLGNAYWDGYQVLFGDGNAVLYNFTNSLDIIGHEVTHGLVQHTAALLYENQSGALNESIADVFGSMIKQWNHDPKQKAHEADWLIGDNILYPGIDGTALRSLKAPGTAFKNNIPGLGNDIQPASMDHYNKTTSDYGGVHINSGIPNHAFYLVAIKFGGYSWKKAGQIWYKSLTHAKMTKDCDFKKFADITCEIAHELFKEPGRNVVKEAWKAVRVLQ
ncbi:hypothetical protein RUND412_006848 [Rhizina undulata]